MKRLFRETRLSYLLSTEIDERLDKECPGEKGEDEYVKRELHRIARSGIYQYNDGKAIIVYCVGFDLMVLIFYLWERVLAIFEEEESST